MNKIIIVAICLIGTIICSTSPLCGVIVKADAEKKKKDFCIDFKEELEEVRHYNVSRCQSDYVCERQYVEEPTIVPAANKTQGICKTRLSLSGFLPGDECIENSQCYSNVCNSKKCQGKNETDACEKNEECSIGLYCHATEKKCKKLLAVDEVCKAHEDCVVTAGCLHGKCLTYYSIETGKPCNDKLFCKSGYEHNGICVETELTEECNAEQKCVYSYKPVDEAKSDKTFPLKCICSLAHSDKQFCPYATNATEHITMLKSIAKVDNVHTIRRRQSSNLEERRTNFIVQKYPQFKDVDDVVIDLYLASTYVKATFFALIAFFLF